MPHESPELAVGRFCEMTGALEEWMLRNEIRKLIERDKRIEELHDQIFQWMISKPREGGEEARSAWLAPAVAAYNELAALGAPLPDGYSFNILFSNAVPADRPRERLPYCLGGPRPAYAARRLAAACDRKTGAEAVPRAADRVRDA